MTSLFCDFFLPKHGYLATLEERFRKEGGIKERMHRVRTGYRAEQDRKMRALEATVKWQEAKIKQLEAEIERLREERKQEDW